MVYFAGSAPICELYMRSSAHHRSIHRSSSIDPSELQVDMYLQKVSIPAEYPVYFTNHAFNSTNPCLVEAIRRLEPKRRHRVCAVIDQGVLKAWPDLPKKLATYARHHAHSVELVALPSVVPGGEQAKNNSRLPVTLQRQLHALGMDRQSVVLIIGGGAVLDMAGYAAATAHRGLRVIRVPTTVLSQADGGLGVKNGINAFGAKNFLGTFAAPFAVINDTQFLASLSTRHRTAGMAEAVKVALIRDNVFFDWLEAAAPTLASLQSRKLFSLIHRSAELHLQHIAMSCDPFETGSARPLDFGHWAAHKLESMTAYRLHHGEAVAIGIAIDSRYSTEIGLLNTQALDRILRLLDRLGLPSWHRALDIKEANGRLKIIRGLDEFKEHIGGELTLTLLKRIGEGTEVGEVNHTALQRTLAWLKKRHASRCVST